MVKLLLPRTDPDAKRMVTQFRDSGIASLSIDGMHYGFVRRVGEEDSSITIVADVTEPEVVAWIRENIDEGGPIEIVPPADN